MLDLGILAAAAKLGAESEEKDTSAEQSIDAELLAYINERIEARKNAKKAKDFATADAIRDELSARGIAILDTREGTKFTIG